MKLFQLRNRVRVKPMCRNIRPLNNFEPPATSAEVHDAALQYVREIAHATEHLLADLISAAPPKNRAEESAKARARSAKRFATAVVAEDLTVARATGKPDGQAGNREA